MLCSVLGGVAAVAFSPDERLLVSVVGWYKSTPVLNEAGVSLVSN
jgi:hypothetical protein